MAYDLSVLDQGCQEMGIVLDGEQRQQFVDFYEYLVEKKQGHEPDRDYRISGGACKTFSGQSCLCKSS